MERFHNFEFIIYYNDSIFLDIIGNDDNINHYAFIYHDKDINVDGSLKVAHYHLLVNYRNAKTFNSALSQFKVPSFNTLCIPFNAKNKIDRFEYLIHKNDLDKYQYNFDCVKYDNLKFWNNQNIDNDKTINLINDLIDNKSLRYMLETYGRDFVINKDKYFSFANALRCEERPITTRADCFTSNGFLIDKNGAIVGVIDEQMSFEELNNISKHIRFNSKK